MGGKRRVLHEFMSVRVSAWERRVTRMAFGGVLHLDFALCAELCLGVRD